jgi:dCMP deaminase
MCYKERMIVGLTGRNAAGKGEVAKFLEGKGFYYHSLSDVIRDEVQKTNLELTREQLVETGRDLRNKKGLDVLAREILKCLEDDKNYVVDSFRHPAEIKAFREQPGFYLVAVEADLATRFKRIKKRGRESDPGSLEEFQALEDKEAESQKSEGQQLIACDRIADFRVNNNGALEELQDQVAELSRQVMCDMARPDWDEYFMRLAKVAALRSNCVKRKVAAVIVRDKRVVSTGYNGTPRGTKNCYEGGCPRCNSLADSGTQLDECLCSHGEENAITQAAYHGVSVKDGTLYTTFAPCLMCTKMIINAGIREVIYNSDYPLNQTSFKLLQEAGVVCRQHQVE